MPKSEIILTQHIVGLGSESDQVKVAAGYARNYLIPHGMAIPLTGANKRRLEALRQRRAEREAHELNSMTELAASISKIVLKIAVKTGADGKMFGAVTAGTIIDELKHQCDVTLEKKKIHLEVPIRTLGEHEVELHLHADVKSKLKVIVESTTPVEAQLVAATENREGRTAEGRSGRGPRTEKPAREAGPARDAKGAKAKTDRKA